MENRFENRHGKYALTIADDIALAALGVAAAGAAYEAISGSKKEPRVERVEPK